ncbi:MAG: tetratricopeptide repeat protein [Elusimicrobia bacterium]|nr:tetratricopeptide repeat protein [Elusimicrobiota bacterium]
MSPRLSWGAYRGWLLNGNLWKVILIGGSLALGLSGGGRWWLSVRSQRAFPRKAADFPFIHRIDQVITKAQEQLTHDPEDLQALTRLAVARFAQGPEHYLEALNVLERARRLGAIDLPLFYYAGVMYEQLALPEYALLEYMKFLRHVPQDFEVRLRAGNLHLKLKQVDQALAQYRTLQRLHPHDPILEFNLALAYQEKGMTAEALRTLTRLYQRTHQLPPVGFYRLGQLWEQSGDWRQAVAAYQKALQLQPKDIPVMEALARAYLHEGDGTAARALWQEILIIEPKHRGAKLQLASLKKSSH